jgi:flagellar biogenesis protein FliO
MAIYVPDENGELTALDQASLALAETTPQIPTGELGATFLKMLLSLVILIALLGATYWFLRRIIQQRLQKGVGDAAIQIVEKRMISPKTILYLIEVNGKKILLAESQLEIKRLEGFESTDLSKSE